MSKNKEYYVYELIDPTTEIPFYIGKGCGLRMYSHVKSVKNGYAPHNNLHLYHKIKQIIDNGNKIKYNKIFISENEKETYNKEIKRISEIGIDNLCNLTYGGEGGTINDEIRQKISKKLKGHFVSDKTKEKISKKLKGRIFPHMGHKHTEKTKQKISLAKKGKIPWNKGLTKETDERVRNIADKTTKYRTGKTYDEIYGKEQARKIKEQHRKRMLENNPMKNPKNIMKYINSRKLVK